MNKYKDLLKRIEKLEIELNKELIERDVMVPWPGEGHFGVPAKILEPTVKTRVDAIQKYLGLNISAKDKECIEAQIVVQAPEEVKDNKKGKK